MKIIDALLSSLNYKVSVREARQGPFQTAVVKRSCATPLSIFLLIFVSILSLGCPGSQTTTKLSVFAAAGAKPAIDEACQKFEEQYGSNVEVSYGGGGEILSKMILS